jgi:RNA polymerase sigma-70 factor (ECF subfamily)
MVTEISKNQENLFKERTGCTFSHMYKTWYGRLVYDLSNICRDRDVAEDLATETFMKAFEQIDKYDANKAVFSTWLYTIGKRDAFQVIKKNKRRPVVSIDVDLDNEGTTLKDFLKEESTTDESVYEITAKKAEIMKKHIQLLKEPYRTIIDMRENKEMRYKDISIERGREFNIILNTDEENIVNLDEEFSEIYSIMNEIGEEVGYELIEGVNYFNSIKVQNKGTYTISGWIPKNLSTIKSLIKKGRELLVDATKEEFAILDKISD